MPWDAPATPDVDDADTVDTDASDECADEASERALPEESGRLWLGGVPGGCGCGWACCCTGALLSSGGTEAVEAEAEEPGREGKVEGERAGIERDRAPFDLTVGLCSAISQHAGAASCVGHQHSFVLRWEKWDYKLGNAR